MPCNLAVTITKAAVLPEHLQALLTDQVKETLLRTYLTSSQKYSGQGTPRIYKLGRLLYCDIGFFTITISPDLQVRVNAPRRGREEAEALSQEITQLLQKGADRLFTVQVQRSLAAKFRNVQTQTATVDNQGITQKVTVFSLEM